VLIGRIGLQDGLGIESLKGSGLPVIAGETSRAYDDIFTTTLAAARTGTCFCVMTTDVPLPLTEIAVWPDIDADMALKAYSAV
jgi:hypothetical protein